ncbi:hypothetical protein Ga0609869_000523 [Rhodovulum iodosum]|uniref:GNAT family N-acetyltransferase n=1 Tax=Rhodovulum iodosum TaxID=68291 RepID=A0ABV3XPC1_9RHOB|nr:hypothetical protein [Rhodovulum robiginosum]RSK31530.1 hypothetical protein EJA01_15475 [Rhodovulum robiginosum]
MREIPLETEGASAVFYPAAPGFPGRRAGAVGQFRCAGAEAGARLLREAAAMARAEGLDDLLGPMDGTTWAPYRLVSWSDGSPPFLMEPCSGPHDLAAFTGAGFAPVMRYLSARVGAAEAAARAVGREIAGLEVAAWDGAAPERLFGEIHELSCRAFARNAFYTPITREAFLGLYLPLVPMIDRRLVFLAREGTTGALTGFLFGIPDYQQGPQPDRAILKTYASLRFGAGHLLAKAFHQAAAEAGFAQVIHALMAETNLSRDRSAGYGAVPFRRYALMGRALDG